MSHYTLLLFRSSHANTHGIIKMMTQHALQMPRCRRRVASIFALCSYALYIIITKVLFFLSRVATTPFRPTRVAIICLSPSFFLLDFHSSRSSISLRVPSRVPASQRLPSRSGHHESNAGAWRELYSCRSGRMVAPRADIHIPSASETSEGQTYVWG